jgi:hypothetical protein
MNETKTELIGTPLQGVGRKCNCFVHQERPATRLASIPCSPGGGIFICDECAKSESSKIVFEAYRASHGKNIKAFKQVNPNS